MIVYPNDLEDCRELLRQACDVIWRPVPPGTRPGDHYNEQSLRGGELLWRIQHDRRFADLLKAAGIPESFQGFEPRERLNDERH